MTAPSERELEADRRHLARTLAQVLKPQRPPLLCQKEYFTVVKLGLAEWAQYTALNLVSDTKPWWRSSGLSIHTPWDTFETDFLNFHTPPSAIAAAREALAFYTHDFRLLIRHVPTLDKGLEPNTSKEVKLKQPVTSEIAITQVTPIHPIL
ncbi:hypothetical protein KI688_011871 [Linnemannia hyalina]|uniref:Uncharacterized protein n=1 Tax=Linnemannia hyalina TaxID=64524 RepID=A0A9P8BUM6_9FUNG|nr:hypothetical protein KI688_011871 [Linnemannia hyalina]